MSGILVGVEVELCLESFFSDEAHCSLSKRIRNRSAKNAHRNVDRAPSEVDYSLSESVSHCYFPLHLARISLESSKTGHDEYLITQLLITNKMSRLTLNSIQSHENSGCSIPNFIEVTTRTWSIAFWKAQNC